jgi:hypothetical protein
MLAMVRARHFPTDQTPAKTMSILNSRAFLKDPRTFPKCLAPPAKMSLAPPAKMMVSQNDCAGDAAEPRRAQG